jgi:heme exporter protein A
MSALLVVENLRVFRGERCLFDNVGFSLEAGQMLLISGVNGSGKTSLLRSIAGLLTPETGDIRWRGQTTQANGQAFRAEMGWFAHRLGLKSDLTVLENLKFEAGLRGGTRSDRDAILARLGLSGFQHRMVRALSAGQQRRVAMSRMILSSATLWLMDEPFTHMDGAGQALVLQFIGEHLATGGIAAVASHQPVELPAVTHRLQLQ